MEDFASAGALVVRRGRLGDLVPLKYYYNEQSQGILTREDLKSGREHSIVDCQEATWHKHCTNYRGSLFLTLQLY